MFAVLGAIAAGAAVIGGITRAIGTAKASKAAEEQAEQNAAFARGEAKQLARARGMAVGDIGRAVGTTVGKIRSVAGASGVKATSGSPLAAINLSYANAERDKARAQLQYNMEIAGRRHEASQYSQQAQSEKDTRFWQVSSSILGSAGQGAGALMPVFG
jgi:hypothetical protein